MIPPPSPQRQPPPVAYRQPEYICLPARIPAPSGNDVRATMDGASSARIGPFLVRIALQITRVIKQAGPLLLIMLLASVAGGLAYFPLHNDDAGFHIATGRYVLQTGHVPTSNPFSYANDHAVWLQHQWLSATIMAWLVDRGGVALLIGCKAVLVGLAFALQGWTLWRQGVALTLLAPLLAVAVWACEFRFYERPYLASILALAATTAALLRWQATGSAKASWLAMLIPAVAIHLHAGALDSLLIWLAFVAGRLLQLGLPPAEPPSTGPSVRQVMQGFAITVSVLVAGLMALAPSGLGLLGLPFSFAGNAYWHEHLAEFRPLAWDAQALPQWLLLALALFALVVATRRRRWFAALVLVGFGFLALRHVRMVWPMAVASVPMIGIVLDPLWRTLRPGMRSATAWVLVPVYISLATIEQHDQFGLGLQAGPVNLQRHPLPLLAKAAQMPQEAFVSDGFAGTWLWQNFRRGETAGDAGLHRVLVHNCLECYEESTYRDVYQTIRYGLPGWPVLVQRYGIATFVLKYTTPGERKFQQGKPNLRQLLAHDPAYVLVDFDDAGELYVARSRLAANLLTLDSFPLDPDTGEPRLAATAEQIRSALTAHAALHPEGVRSLDMAIRLELRAGKTQRAVDLIGEMARRQPDSPQVLFWRDRLSSKQNVN